MGREEWGEGEPTRKAGSLLTLPWSNWIDTLNSPALPALSAGFYSASVLSVSVVYTGSLDISLDDEFNRIETAALHLIFISIR
jgi:hypothetical protein